MKVGHRFRFYPKEGQRKALDQLFGCVRYVYNRALALRVSTYKETGKGLTYCRSSAALTEWKAQIETTWLREVAAVPLQQTLRHLNSAYKNFFEKRARYPKFKRKHANKQSAQFTRNAFVWDPSNHHITIAKIGRLDVHWSRVIKVQPSSISIIKDAAGRYFVTLTVEEDRSKLPPSRLAIGIDMGLKQLATLSTGEVIAPLQILKRNLRGLARAQRVLSRRVKGSGRRHRARLKVARLHAKAADTRNDYWQKTTTDLVRRFGTIAVEDLNVRGMLRNRKLARAITDAGFYSFRRMLEYKCAWYGRELLFAGRFEPTSKRCSDCGSINQGLTLDQRDWTCECGTIHDRDHNAAKNILAAGQAVSARGGNVRRALGLSGARNSRRSVNQPELCNV